MTLLLCLLGYIVMVAQKIVPSMCKVKWLPMKIPHETTKLLFKENLSI